MGEILVPVDAPPRADALHVVADALAAVLHAEVRTVRLPAHEGSGRDASALAEALDAPTSVLTVLPAESSPDALCWRLLPLATKAVVLVPDGTAHPRSTIGRVLIPLDGSPEAADAVASAVTLLADSGVDLVALHVFDTAHVPRFWDQTAHAGGAWCEEFLSRHLPSGSPRLELRAGSAGQRVLDVAGTEDVDLIVMGWSQRLEPGRARTVRQAVTESEVPVLLCPVRGREDHPDHDRDDTAAPERDG